jgi:hypothetical protein
MNHEIQILQILELANQLKEKFKSGTEKKFSKKHGGRT